MDNFKMLFESDISRYENGPDRWTRRYLYLFRKASTVNSGLIKYLFRFVYLKHSEKHGIEIGRDTIIGKGFYIGHPYGITINGSSVLGENINIHKGVTIGRENRGKREGAPIIGNKVWIGVNSTIVGHIVVGNDVLIAPNTYVNCNIPDHSIVIGNPCKIINAEDATSGYITNIV